MTKLGKSKNNTADYMLKKARSFFLMIYLLGVFIGMLRGKPIEHININQDKNVHEIFFHNLFIGISMITLGSMTGGIYSIIIICMNGYILGKLIRYLFKNNLVYLIISGILPHAIIEVACLCVMASLSAISFNLLIEYLKDEYICIGKVWRKSFIWLLISITGLYLSAIIECYVSIVVV